MFVIIASYKQGTCMNEWGQGMGGEHQTVLHTISRNKN